MRTTFVNSDAEFDAAVRALRAADAAADGEAHIDERLESVRAIVGAVRARGDAAVAEFTARFDGAQIEPARFEISAEEMDRAYRSVDGALLGALERAHENIRRFHARNLRIAWEERFEHGVLLGQRVTPLDRVGVYVPGGKAFYVSSVLMNIVPARVAGVPEILMVSPPTYEGTVHPLILAAARVAGVTRVFRVGGAQAIAALAYGTATIPAVHKITGPGNIFVTLAKRLISSVCDIDKEAGPSEVVVIADATADPRFVAAELLAQAEHDEDARAILVTTSRELVDRVTAVMEEETASLSRASYIRAALATYGCTFVVPTLDKAIALTNEIAPEHLSIQTADPRAVMQGIRHAGCIVLGGLTPVAVGDYFAGPNHILPTGRRARFAGPLTADDFRKVSSVIEYTNEGIEAACDDIRRIAEAEGFTAHARAVERRCPAERKI